MKYNDYFKITPEMKLLEEQRKEKVAKLQERINAAACKVNEVIEKTFINVQTGKVTKSHMQRDFTIKFTIKGVGYSNIRDIMADYELTQSAVWGRLYSKNATWKDWIKLPKPSD